MSGVWLGLGLALAASLALNLGYLLQHGGAGTAPPVTPRHPVATLRGLFASPIWLAGLGVGLSGWALHVLALSRAPLSLVQAFVAGGLVLCVPLAAVALGHRVTAGEARGVALMSLALAGLSLGLHARAHSAHLVTAPLAAYMAVAGAAALALAAAPATPARRAAALGAAGGVLYGAADLAIKALTDIASRHGAAAVARSPWLAAPALATAGAFFCFQRALQMGRALPVIALMTAATNAVSILGGLLVLGEPLGRTPGLAALHAGAFLLLAVAAWMLAPAQAALAGTVGGHQPQAGGPAGASPPRSGAVRSSASQPTSRSRSARSAAAPPLKPNSRFARSR
jgi:uncharacterized membrane protein